MKRLSTIAIIVAFTLAASPVFAQSNNDGGGTGAVAGEGPGGSGAGQTSGGPGRLKVKNKAHRKAKPSKAM